MTKITITKEMYDELAGLYINQVVANKFELDEQELESVRENNVYSAERLDELGVPWKIQNAVAFAGTKRENWSRYLKDVVYDTIEKHNK